MMQDIKTWMQVKERTTIVEVGAATFGTSGSQWGDAEAGNITDREANLPDDYDFDDVFGDSDFTLVQSRKKKKSKQATRPSNVPGEGSKTQLVSELVHFFVHDAQLLLV